MQRFNKRNYILTNASIYSTFSQGSKPIRDNLKDRQAKFNHVEFRNSRYE